jgi:hypothetical protein
MPVTVSSSYPEPVFVNVLGAKESVPRNRFRQAKKQFLGSLKVYKYGLFIGYTVH